MNETETHQRWKDEIDFAQKDERYKAWLDTGERIYKRYRDSRKEVTGAFEGTRARRLNILWSNVQTLQPAVYARMPKAIVERRFMDKDPAGRLASQILERCLHIQMEAGYFHESVGQAVTDWLLPGMGQVWLRYEPQFEATEEGAANEEVDSEEKTAQDVQQDGDGGAYEKLAYERVCIDYLYYRDFLWGPARYWREVPWVARRFWLSTSEIAERFYDGDMEKAKKIVTDYMPERLSARDADREGDKSYFLKAEIWEVWNKADQTVYIIPCATPGVMLKVEKNPVLKLECFWPCPKPLMATETNDTVVPVPDYVEYEDQAKELDDLTNRIAMITTAVRANGVYDASIPELQRLLQDGQDNKLIPVDQWAAFAEKGGIPGAVSLLPMQEIVDVLIRLHEARTAVKTDLYEITGMSDIVRGQAEGGAKTATEQRIKGQFASLRLQDKQTQVNLFCRDILRIQSEIICEMFTPETLMQMSGIDLQMRDDAQKAAEGVPQPPPPQPPQQQEGMDPRMMQVQALQAQAQATAAQQQYSQAVQQAQQQSMQKSMQEFQRAVEILKSDKLRGFRVDIETDSTISIDAAADKQAANELILGVTQALTAMGPIIQAAPELSSPLFATVMWAYRQHRVGRQTESLWEDAIDRIEERIDGMKNQPPPPSPEEIKAQADAAAQQAKMQADQQKNAMEAERADKKAQLEAGLADQKMQMETATREQEMQMKREEHDMTMQQLAAKAVADQANQAAKDDDRQFQRQNEQEKQGFAREQHQQAMQAKQSERDGKRAEMGLPPENVVGEVVGELTAAREDTTKVMLSMADAIKEQGTQFAQAIDSLAGALTADKEVTAPDGRVFRSKVVQ